VLVFKNASIYASVELSKILPSQIPALPSIDNINRSSLLP
jgi:hypothetical protein